VSERPRCEAGTLRAPAAPSPAPDIAAARRAALAAFLGASGWDAEPPVPLAADASFRSYYRLRRGRKRAVLMDAPPPQEDVAVFAAVATMLRQLGLSAPKILAADLPRGFLLVEDFGDDTYNRLLAEGRDEFTLYALAVDALIALQRRVAARQPPALEAYDERLLLAEAALLVDWYWPAVLGVPIGARLRADYLELWRWPLAEAAAPFAPTLVLRDFHIDNLVFLRRRTGVRRCGLLDFQDAVRGPPSYDLVSLVADARRDVSAELARAMTERYLAAFPHFDRRAFRGSAAVFSAQRNCKILGIFTRLWRRDGKPRYLRHIPRIWRILEGDLRHPSLSPVKRWLDRHLPAEARRVPEVPSRVRP
jgi:N-acetylmuramate 1-kinase